MRYKGLDLNLLAALEVLLSERNVTRAAGRLNLTQSATSSALARLREQFGDDLLIPAGRDLRRSALAEEILPKVRAILAQVDNNLLRDRNIDPRVVRRDVRIMASDYVALTVLGPGLAKIASEAPGLHFEIVPVTDAVALAIENYSIDLLIAPDVYVSSRHPSAFFFYDDYVALACIKNTRLSGVLAKDEYLSTPQVSVRFQLAGALPHDEKSLEQDGNFKMITITVRSHALMPYFVMETSRIATLQRRQGEIFARQFPLKILELSEEIAIPPIREMFQWHESNNGDPVLDYVCNTLRTIAQDAVHDK